ncbi:hypothetical protein F5I97DRAFT_1242550 [Phlebopus sp. FC_14]|nr:hypothetical protein F5I97DRAFT_1242550 [Phlebopus sp. FC_14]
MHTFFLIFPVTNFYFIPSIYVYHDGLCGRYYRLFHLLGTILFVFQAISDSHPFGLSDVSLTNFACPNTYLRSW